MAQQCPYGACPRPRWPETSARAFTNPTLAVEVAVARGLIADRSSVFEFGAGNLRNARYVLGNLPHVRYSAFDLPETVKRFHRAYAQLARRGMRLVDDYARLRGVDTVICTFVLETICPRSRRIGYLRNIASTLRPKGLLIASFRGYPGTRGNTYRECPNGEGLISPHGTFVKPVSVREAQALLRSAGFKDIEVLQHYRTNSPENIHVAARGA